MMSLIMDELVRAVCTAAPCCRNALARWAENVLSSYLLCRVAMWTAPCIFICATYLGWLGQPVHTPGIITGRMPQKFTPLTW
jgi:hypothetical protein